MTENQNNPPDLTVIKAALVTIQEYVDDNVVNVKRDPDTLSFTRQQAENCQDTVKRNIQKIKKELGI
ncbi:MAG: hypothetical protein ABI543_06795 [Ignavibacteria bacterium]